jgi:hypothetical protein
VTISSDQIVINRFSEDEASASAEEEKPEEATTSA